MYAPSTILSIAFMSLDPSCNAYASGIRAGHIQATTNGGTTWVDLDPTRTLPARPVNGLAFDPSNVKDVRVPGSA